MNVAVVLFNLGGPDKLDNVEPFLFNLFNDPAILNLPSFIRYPLAKLISKRRTPTAKAIYKEMGGSSPIVKLTRDQAEKKILTLKKDLFNIRFKKINNQIENPAQYNEIKKNIARLYTTIKSIK